MSSPGVLSVKQRYTFKGNSDLQVKQPVLTFGFFALFRTTGIVMAVPPPALAHFLAGFARRRPSVLLNDGTRSYGRLLGCESEVVVSNLCKGGLKSFRDDVGCQTSVAGLKVPA